MENTKMELAALVALVEEDCVIPSPSSSSPPPLPLLLHHDSVTMAAVKEITHKPCEVRQKIRAVPLRGSGSTRRWRKLCTRCYSASSGNL